MPEPIDIAGSSSTPLLGGTITPMPHALTITREQWRYHFAGLAMNAYIHAGYTVSSNLVAWSVRDADALLAELERTEP